MSNLSKKSRSARRRRTGRQSARIWQFEQLESRAMLAVMGPMPYYGGDHGPQVQSYHESFRFEAVMFAPPMQQYSVAGPADHGWGGGPMQGGFHDNPVMFRQIGVIEVRIVGPTNPDHFGSTQPATGLSEYLDSRGTAIAQDLGDHGNDAGDRTFSSAGQSISSNSFNNPPLHVVPSDDVWNLPPDYNHKGLGDEHNYLISPGDVGGFLQAARSASSSIVSQSTPREVESAAFVWTSALDAALQSYTSQLLLATSATSGQVATSIKSSDQSLPNSDSADDFIRLGESASQDLFAASTDAISQERAAVEAVLKSLKDADDLPSKLDGADVANAVGAPQDQNGQIADLVFGSEFDLADADGGMILLKATGDANESPINLASVAEAHPDLFSGHIGVEPSVGLYQAIDMGFEELSATENVPVAKPTAQPAQQAKPDNHYSSNSSNASNSTNSRKSAAALTVSTLAGGLLWVASRKKSDEDDGEECSESQLVH